MFTKQRKWIKFLVFILIFFLIVVWIRQKRSASFKPLVSGEPSTSSTPTVPITDPLLQYRTLIKKTFGDRVALVKAPTTWNKKVVIVLHGRTQDADVWFDGSSDQNSFTAEALKQGFLVIAPDSISPYCKSAKQWDYTTRSIDFSFIESIFSWAEDSLGAEKIYIIGISSGGFMTERLAITYPKTINAVVIHSAGSPDNAILETSGVCGVKFNTNTLSIPTTHPPTYLLHGQTDRIVDYEIGRNLYTGLVASGIKTEMYTKPMGRHQWFSEQNRTILEWLKKW